MVVYAEVIVFEIDREAVSVLGRWNVEGVEREMPRRSRDMNTHEYRHMCIYAYTQTHIYTYVHIYIERENIDTRIFHVYRYIKRGT